MTDRRQLLRLGGLAGLGAILAACGGRDEAQELAKDLPAASDSPLGAMTVTDRVTNETGLLGLVDAITRHEGAAFQWQHYSLLSDKGPDSGGRDLCARFQLNRIVPNEKQVNLIVIGSRDPMDYQECPHPTVPEGGYLEIPIRPDGTPATEGNCVRQGSNLYLGRGAVYTYNNRCSQSVQTITGGWVRFTRIDDVSTEGSYQVTGAFGTYTGDFVAPFCALTAPRPSKVTCGA